MSPWGKFRENLRKLFLYGYVGDLQESKSIGLHYL